MLDKKMYKQKHTHKPPYYHGTCPNSYGITTGPCPKIIALARVPTTMALAWHLSKNHAASWPACGEKMQANQCSSCCRWSIQHAHPLPNTHTHTHQTISSSSNIRASPELCFMRAGVASIQSGTIHHCAIMLEQSSEHNYSPVRLNWTRLMHTRKCTQQYTTDTIWAVKNCLAVSLGYNTLMWFDGRSGNRQTDRRERENFECWLGETARWLGEGLALLWESHTNRYHGDVPSVMDSSR